MAHFISAPAPARRGIRFVPDQSEADAEKLRLELRGYAVSTPTRAAALRLIAQTEEVSTVETIEAPLVHLKTSGSAGFGAARAKENPQLWLAVSVSRANVLPCSVRAIRGSSLAQQGGSSSPAMTPTRCRPTTPLGLSAGRRRPRSADRERPLCGQEADRSPRPEAMGETRRFQSFSDATMDPRGFDPKRAFLNGRRRCWPEERCCRSPAATRRPRSASCCRCC